MRLAAIGKFLSSFALLAIAVLISHANGAMLVSETFTYADGGLVGKDPPIGGAWAAHSGAGATPVLVTSGTISIAQGSGSREDVNVPYEGGYTLGAGGALYSGFDLTVADPSAAVQDVYFGMFLTGTSAFDARVWMTAPATSGYRLALSNDNALDGDGEAFTGDLAFGTTYRVVTKYDYDGKSAKLWINPVDESSASISATDPGLSDASFAYAFRQAGGNTTQVIDNLYVSTTFDGANTGVEIPEPATAALAMIVGLALVGLRRRAK
jgi:hypothetical protein